MKSVVPRPFGLGGGQGGGAAFPARPAMACRAGKSALSEHSRVTGGIGCSASASAWRCNSPAPKAGRGTASRGRRGRPSGPAGQAPSACVRGRQLARRARRRHRRCVRDRTSCITVVWILVVVKNSHARKRRALGRCRGRRRQARDAGRPATKGWLRSRTSGHRGFPAPGSGPEGAARGRPGCSARPPRGRSVLAS